MLHSYLTSNTIDCEEECRCNDDDVTKYSQESKCSILWRSVQYYESCTDGCENEACSLFHSDSFIQDNCSQNNRKDWGHVKEKKSIAGNGHFKSDVLHYLRDERTTESSNCKYLPVLPDRSYCPPSSILKSCNQ